MAMYDLWNRNEALDETFLEELEEVKKEIEQQLDTLTDTFKATGDAQHMDGYHHALNVVFGKVEHDSTDAMQLQASLEHGIVIFCNDADTDQQFRMPLMDMIKDFIGEEISKEAKDRLSLFFQNAADYIRAVKERE